jgi:cellulose synthase/poly-beta-1,6-N-acetylglucosamine synthase-like glycosyltransferase
MYWLPAILILPYFFLLLKICRNLRKIKPFTFSSAPSTFVSVIIACRNEEKRLPALLDSLSRQDYPLELFEVIIVDDNSSDKSYETASENRDLRQLKVLKNEGRGKKEALRTGIIASKGSLILTTDADCTMGKNWIKTAVAFFEINSPELIISAVQLNGIRGFFGKFQELEYLGLQGVTAGSVMAGDGIMCNSANLAFTKEAYLKHMADLRFDLNTGDDVFMLHSMKKDNNSGIMWLESAESIVTTSSSSTVLSFLEQRKRWISKWRAYSDEFTIRTGIITFIAILLQLAAFISLFFNISFIWLFLIILALKSLPDFLILRNTTARYGKTELMHWFLPAQLIYPLYVTGVLLYSIVPERGKSD